MTPRPPSSPPFPTRRSSDLAQPEIYDRDFDEFWETSGRERVSWFEDFTKLTRSRPDRKSTRLNSSHLGISYAVFCLKKKKPTAPFHRPAENSTPSYPP